MDGDPLAVMPRPGPLSHPPSSLAVFQPQPPSARHRPGPGLFAQLWRRRWLFAAVFITTLAAVIAVLMVLPSRYSASGSVIIAEQEPNIGNASAAWVQKLGDPADLESQLLLLRSPRMIRLAMAQPGFAAAAQTECAHDEAGSKFSLGRLLGSATKCDSLTPDSAKLLDWVSSRYGVGAVGRSRVISVAYQSALPEVARTLTNALITVFLVDQREINAQSREDAASWLWKEVAQLDTTLRADEEQIQTFRRENGLVRGQLAPISSERLSSISQQLSAAQGSRADAIARVQELGRGGPVDLPTSPARGSSDGGGAGDSRAALDNLAISSIKQQLATVVAQIASSAQTLGPKHPVLLALRQQEAGLRGQLRAEANSVGVSARRTLSAANSQVAALNAEQEKLKAAVTVATDKEAAIADMVRAVEIKRGQYETLYKRASELETERRVLTGSTRLVSLAELPTLPFFPKRGPFLAAGLTLATILAAAASFLRDVSDLRIRAAAPVEEATQTQVLAEIPTVTAARMQGRMQGRMQELIPFGIPGVPRGAPALLELLGSAQRSPLVQDALRMLHARLVLMGLGTANRKILITSAEPREGKTFTCLALAQLIAESGRRVLVIECDLRRPSFAAALGLRDGPGLSDVLRGDVTAADAVQQTRTALLNALPAGRPCAESTELLMGRRMAEMLHGANGYDLVLLDSPPSEVLMDARMLAPQVDGVLCCARWGQTSSAEVAGAIDGLRAAGGTVLGVVLTMVDPNEHRLYDWRPARQQVYMNHG